MKPQLIYQLIQLLEGLGMGSFFPIYTPWLELHGLNFFKMGVVNFFYHIISSMLDPFTGFLADKFGKRKSFIVGQILWTITQFVYGSSSQIGGFLVAEGVAAVGHSLKSDTLESWLQNELGENESARVMGKSKLFFSIGQILSSIFAGYIAEIHGMHLAWYISGSFFLAATLIAAMVLFRRNNTTENRDLEKKINIKTLFILAGKNSFLYTAMIFSAVYSFCTKPLFMYWPQIVSNLEMPDAMRGWIILAISLPAIGGGLLAGHNILFTRDKKGIPRLLTVTFAGLIISGTADSLFVFLVGLVIMEMAHGAFRIVLYGMVYLEDEDKHRTTINSLISASYTLGGAVSLLGMGQLADLLSPQIALVIGGSIALVSIIFFRTTGASFQNKNTP